MVVTYSSNDFRAKIRDILNSIEYQGQTAIIERYGRAVGAVIPQEQYLEYQKLKRDRQASLNLAGNEFVDITEELMTDAY